MAEEKSERIAITDKLRRELHAHQQHTGVSAYALLNRAADIPEDLSPSTINNWLSGQSRTARKEYMDHVCRMWSSLPDNSERIELTDEILSGFRSHIDRTGLALYAFCRLSNLFFIYLGFAKHTAFL